MSGLLTQLGHVGLVHYLVVGALLFVLGLVTVATRRSAVAMLMGIELILNAAAINFVAFAHFVDGGMSGMVFAVFVIVLAAAEAAVALAIVLAVFRHFHTADATQVATLRD
jgi:NADH-quinone oxidoreductase subunit K